MTSQKPKLYKTQYLLTPSASSASIRGPGCPFATLIFSVHSSCYFKYIKTHPYFILSNNWYTVFCNIWFRKQYKTSATVSYPLRWYQACI